MNFIKKMVKSHRLLIRLFLIIIFDIILFCQDAFAETHESKTQCGKESMSLGPKLISHLHTISLHNNLTDIPFLENTLKVKFKRKQANEGSEVPNRGRFIYSGLLFNGAIDVEVDINSDKEQIKNSSTIAIIHFYIIDKQCVQINTNDIYAAFEGGKSAFDEFLATDSFTISEVTQRNPTNGINNSKIKLIYGVNKVTGLVDGFTIRQFPGN